MNEENLAKNCVRWAEVAKQELPPDVGFIMIMFNKARTGQSAGVVTANVKRDGLLAQLKAVLAKFTERRIVTLDDN